MTIANLSTLLNQVADEAVQRTPDPWPALRSQLHVRNARFSRRFGHAHRWQLVAAIAVVIAVGVSLLPVATSSESVKAAEILDRAYAATSSGPLRAIRSYHLLATRTTTPASGIFNEQRVEAWFSAPDRRHETIRCGDCPTEMTSDVVENGDHSWSITSVGGHAYVLAAEGPGANVDLLVPLGSTPADLLRRAQQLACGTATLRGTATVATRSAYVVTVDHHSGDSCPAAPSFGVLGRFARGEQTDTFWIDQESYLLLRAEQHLPQERVGQQLVTYVVSSVEYNAALSDALFEYAPPARATVVASAAELKAALSRAIAK